MSAAFWRRVHLAKVLLWALLLVPTVIWWRENIFWLIFMSWYAIFATEITAWQAARAEEGARR